VNSENMLSIVPHVIRAEGGSYSSIVPVVFNHMPQSSSAVEVDFGVLKGASRDLEARAVEKFGRLVGPNLVLLKRE